MSGPFCVGEDSPKAISPVWGDILGSVRAGVSNLDVGAGPKVEASLDDLHRAHSILIVALERPTPSDETAVSELRASATQLLSAVVAIWSFHKPGSDRREALGNLLERRLSAHERSI